MIARRRVVEHEARGCLLHHRACFLISVFGISGESGERPSLKKKTAGTKGTEGEEKLAGTPYGLVWGWFHCKCEGSFSSIFVYRGVNKTSFLSPGFP